MLRRIKNAQRGDTLIEVLFAFTVLSLVVVGAMTIMNQGTIASQRALETTFVRQEIDSQATTLRFLHDAYVASFIPGATYEATTPAGQWAKMSAEMTATTASSFDGSDTCPTPPTGSFIMNTATATYVAGTQAILIPAVTSSQVTYTSNTVKNAEGIWIEGVKSAVSADVNKKNVRYIDFHIRACWQNPGEGLAMRIGTIVRLYEPQN